LNSEVNSTKPDPVGPTASNIANEELKNNLEEEESKGGAGDALNTLMCEDEDNLAGTHTMHVQDEEDPTHNV
jgi:hypothetical protein